METISLQSAPQLPRIPAAVVKKGETSVPATPVKQEAAVAMPDLEKMRRARIQAAAAPAADSFVLGDQKFTLFKDSSGQFVTRYTSLRDGRVTYVPELDVLAAMRRKGTEIATLQLNV